jgi:hypothetical protein
MAPRFLFGRADIDHLWSCAGIVGLIHGRKRSIYWRDPVCILRVAQVVKIAQAWHGKCPETGMKTILSALLSAALVLPVVLAPTALSAQTVRSYHDKEHNDDHQWNNHEDQAYRMYAKENHHKYSNFSKLKENDQQAYWGWRHDHSDAILKINIR